MRFVRRNDGVFIAGHKFTNNVNAGELKAVEAGTSQFSCGTHGVLMRMAETTDSYAHTSHSLLHYSVYDDGKHKLVDTLSHSQYKTGAHQVRFFTTTASDGGACVLDWGSECISKQKGDIEQSVKPGLYRFVYED